MLTIKQINNYIQNKYCNISLVKHNKVFKFKSTDSCFKNCKTTIVNVKTLNSLTVEQWMWYLENMILDKINKK